MSDTDEADECERLGHDDSITHEDEDAANFVCSRCGAEWWEDRDNA